MKMAAYYDDDLDEETQLAIALAESDQFSQISLDEQIARSLQKEYSLRGQAQQSSYEAHQHAAAAARYMMEARHGPDNGLGQFNFPQSSMMSKPSQRSSSRPSVIFTGRRSQTEAPPPTPDSQLMAAQNRAYEEAKARDLAHRQRQQEEALAAAAEELAASARETEKVRIQLENQQRLEEERRRLEQEKEFMCRLPEIQIPIDDHTPQGETVTVQFRLPDGRRTANYQFHLDEPVGTLYQQIRHELQNTGQIRLRVPMSKPIESSPDTPLRQFPDLRGRILMDAQILT
jgi:hypothetical protein